jgi:hypothetical protein
MITEKSVYKIENDETAITPAFGGALKRSEQVRLHIRKFDKLVKNLYLIY